MAAEEEAAPAAPDWIVTFTDLVSLLVAFFVLLMTFSSLDHWDAFQVKGDLLGTRGTITQVNGASLVDPPKDDMMSAIDVQRGSEHPHSRPPQHLLENLDEMGQKQTDEHIDFDLTAVRDGIVLHFDERSTFHPGSATPTPDLRKSLAEIGKVLTNYAHMITIEGFTDNAFQATPEYPEEEALACARAVAAAEILTREGGVSPLLVQVAGLGSARPLNENGTPSERSANRRIELRILSLSRTRAEHLERQGG